MLILDATTQSLVCVTGKVASLDYVVCYADHTTTTLTPGTSKGNIPTNTTTTICPAPAASTQRQILYISLSNKATTTQDITLAHDTSGTKTNVAPIFTLQPNESFIYKDGTWQVVDSRCAIKQSVREASGVGGNLSAYLKVGTASEAAGVWYSHHKDSGFPGAWAPGAPGLAGRATDGTTATDNGCLIVKTPAVGNNYLKQFIASNTVVQSNWLFDILWVNSGIVVTTTTAQTINSVALPARDYLGTTNGEGCWVGLLVTTATTNAAAITNCTLSYTNQAGTAGRTATMASFPATAVIGTVVWFQLQAGDYGVRSIQTITLGTSMVAGAVSLIIGVPVANTGAALANTSSIGTVLNKDETGVRLYNGVCLIPMYISTATTATTTTGGIIVENR